MANRRRGLGASVFQEVTLKFRVAAWYLRHRIVKATGLHGKEKKQMLELIKKLLGASWEVTIIGWFATALGVTSTVGWTKPDGTINWAAVGLAVLGAIFSRMTKQSNVTGGSVPATLEAVDRIQTSAPAAVILGSVAKVPSAKADAAAITKAEK